MLSYQSKEKQLPRIGKGNSSYRNQGERIYKRITATSFFASTSPIRGDFANFWFIKWSHVSADFSWKKFSVWNFFTSLEISFEMAATATPMTLTLVAGHAWCLFLKILPIFDLCCQCGQPLLRVVIPETKRREFKISLQFDLSQKVVGWSQRARIQIQRSPVRIPLKSTFFL